MGFGVARTPNLEVFRASVFWDVGFFGGGAWGLQRLERIGFRV